MERVMKKVIISGIDKIVVLLYYMIIIHFLFQITVLYFIYYRKLGNQKYIKKIPREAVELYTQSIANAKTNSREISLAYANRSAVLFEYKLYRECLEV